ncbi:hypothetical protein RIF29_20908 [Crotalaria pallida]|uniref:Uncharacterized protein n=1 Tax=Crotalaria pallida TaxID=3830 RepID=A0AAN9F6G8_CROPI
MLYLDMVGSLNSCSGSLIWSFRLSTPSSSFNPQHYSIRSDSRDYVSTYGEDNVASNKAVLLKAFVEKAAHFASCLTAESFQPLSWEDMLNSFQSVGNPLLYLWNTFLKFHS